MAGVGTPARAHLRPTVSLSAPACTCAHWSATRPLRPVWRRSIPISAQRWRDTAPCRRQGGSRQTGPPPCFLPHALSSSGVPSAGAGYLRPKPQRAPLPASRAASIDEEQCLETELRHSDEPLNPSNGNGSGSGTGAGEDSSSESSDSSAGSAGGFGIDNKQLAAMGELCKEDVYTAGIISSIQASRHQEAAKSHSTLCLEPLLCIVFLTASSVVYQGLALHPPVPRCTGAALLGCW